ILSAIALTACVDQVGFTAVDIGQSNDEAPVDPGPNPDNPPPPDEPQPPAPEPDPTPEPEPPAPLAPSPSPTVTETPPPPPPAPSPSPSPSVVVCDPFSNGGQADPKNGIKATLHYFEVGDPRISNVQSTQNFAAG